VTADEISPEQACNQEIRCWYNGKLVQSANTKDHIFTVAQVIEHCSKLLRLLPGDLIYMGTPMGTMVETAVKTKDWQNVGWMKPGGVLKSEVTGLGICENKVLSQAEWAATKTGGAHL
jgi:2-keto-4-pentenoate hydratase/2-oxohepta-3-ene-1,7-dioic acid hydratase in catechol pathway